MALSLSFSTIKFHVQPVVLFHQLTREYPYENYRLLHRRNAARCRCGQH